jgi:hypothetical protein
MTFVDFGDFQEVAPVVTKEQELAKANEVIKGSIPIMEESPDTFYSLPRGIYTGDGKWETEVELRELTGADEEILAARSGGATEFFDAVVTLGTASVGSTYLADKTFSERQDYLSKLLIGERDQLFLQIARVTYGDKKTMEHVCPSCEVQLNTDVSLTEHIKCAEMENPHKQNYIYTTAKGHDLGYRLAIGSDQMEVSAQKGSNLAEQNTFILSKCIISINGDPVVNPLSTARDLSMGDRRKLLEILVSQQPSPNLEITIPCPSCDFEMILPLSWGDIFRP